MTSITKRAAAVGGLVLTLTVTSPRFYRASVDDEAKGSPVFDELTVSDWRYRTVDLGRRDQIAWELETFGPAKIRWQAIKGLDELKDWENTFYRFVIQEHTFPSRTLVDNRAAQIGGSPPELQSGKADAHWVLSDGFAIGTVVYLISTHSTKFDDEALGSLLNQVKACATRNE